MDYLTHAGEQRFKSGWTKNSVGKRWVEMWGKYRILLVTLQTTQCLLFVNS